MMKTKTKEAECLVSGALSTTFWLCQIFGVAPIKIKRTQDGDMVSVSRKLYIVQCIFITIIAASMIFIVSMNVKSQDDCMWHFIWNIIMIGSINAVYGAPTRLRATIEALSSIQKINNSIGFQKKWSTERKKSATIVILTIYFMCIVVVNPRTVSQSRDSWGPLFYTLHSYQYTVLLLVNIKFTLCALEVASTLRSFNELLDYISRTNLQGLEAAYKTKRSSKTLEETFHHLATNYSEVCKVVKLLDTGNGSFLMLMILATFLSLVYAPNLFIVHYFRDQPPVWNAIWIIQWAVLHFFWLLLIIQPCHEIQQESERANFTTSKLLVMCEDEVCMVQLEKLSQNFLLTNVSFTPCGICTLSQTLLSSIMMRVTTYLIIVIQFNY